MQPCLEPVPRRVAERNFLSQARSLIFRALVLLPPIALPITSAFARAGDATAQSPTLPSFGGIGFLLAYLTRRREIGGWLFYFYLQLYLSLALTALFTATSLGALEPSKWARTDQYMWFLLGWAPAVMAQCVEVSVATYLLTRRTEQNVHRLRYAIIALLISSGVSIAIDLTVFSASADAVVLDGMTFVLSAIWLAYFYKSARVRSVFIEHNWVFYEDTVPTKTPVERKYLRTRALIWGCGLYMLGFVFVGVGQADKKPDPAFLFGVPVVYGLLAALISYVCPISRRKRANLGSLTGT